jgi:hypothetical protein
VNQADQIPKNHGANASDDAQSERHEGEVRQRQLSALLVFHHGLRRICGGLF